MNRQTALQAKETGLLRKNRSSWLQHVAVRPIAEAEHETFSGSTAGGLAVDLTSVPVRPQAQVAGQTATRSCPMSPQRCPFGGACHSCPPLVQAKLKIGQPGDKYEQEADRVADAIVSEYLMPQSISNSSTKNLQRLEREPEKSKEEKIEEVLEKLVEAALETPQFKQILDLLKKDTPYKRGKEFAGTLPGFLSISSIIAGLGTAGAAALIDASEELPMQIPEIPLGGGHSVKLTINGTLDEPSDWSIAYTFTATSDESSSDTSADTKRIRAETNRLVMQNEYTSTHTNIVPNSSETLTERAKRIYQESNTGLVGLRPIQVDIPPIGDQKSESGLRLTSPKSSVGYQSEEPLIGSSLKLTLPNERKKREEDTALQRKSNNAGTFDSVPPIVHDVISSAGQPLDYSTRSFMEPRFGQDFSGVRVHTDGQAAESARAVNARAYTVGRNVVFGEGQYVPGSDEGKRLVAHELVHVGQQRAITGFFPLANQSVIARKPNASGLLAPQKVQDVYGAWVLEYLRARNTTVLSEELDKEVRARVKKQVGPANFANWEHWEEALQSKIEQQSFGDEPKKTNKEPFNPQAELLARHDQMWANTKRLREEVVRMEYLAQKLNFGTGVKGATARAGASGHAALWGVGGRTVSSVAERAPMVGLCGAGLMLGSEMAERCLVKQGQEIKREGEEMGGTAQTAVKLVGGDLQAAYLSTRPAYNNYEKAFSDFTDASSKFKKDLQLDGIDGYSSQAKDISKMESAMKAMHRAGNEFFLACTMMGIQADAHALDAMAVHTVKGMQDTVGTAVFMAMPEVAPGLGEIRTSGRGLFRGAFKGAEGAGARQAEKAVAERAATSVVKKSDGAVTTGAARQLESAAESGSKAAVKKVEGAVTKQTEKAVAERATTSVAKNSDEAAIAEARQLESSTERGSKSAASEANDAAATGVKRLKKPPEAEAKQIKQIVKDKEAIKSVSDPKYTREYDYEIVVDAGGEKHTYRRKISDGTWCRFSKKTCGIELNDVNEALKLWSRYQKMSDFELLVRIVENSDETAVAVLRQKYPTNYNKLIKIAEDNYRPPHYATAIHRRGNKEIDRLSLKSGGIKKLPKKEVEGLSIWQKMQATHTERWAIRNTKLDEGDFLEIIGQYDPCPACKRAMQEATNESKATIKYWWPGGEPITFSPQ